MSPIDMQRAYELFTLNTVKFWEISRSSIRTKQMRNVTLRYATFSSCYALNTVSALMPQIAHSTATTYVSMNKMTKDLVVLSVADAIELGVDNIIKAFDEKSSAWFYCFSYMMFVGKYEEFVKKGWM